MRVSTVLFALCATVASAHGAPHVRSARASRVIRAPDTRERLSGRSSAMITVADRGVVRSAYASDFGGALPSEADKGRRGTVGDSKGFKTLHSVNQSISIFADAELSQPSGDVPYATSSSGQNGAAPLVVETLKFDAFDKVWSRYGKDATTASRGGTTATLECDVTPERTATNCSVSAIATATGHVRWTDTFPNAIPADHVNVAVTPDGAFVAVAVTEFTPPLPSHSFHSSLRIYNTHTGTPVAVHNAANETQARDLSVGTDVIALVSMDSVDVYSVADRRVSATHTFDFSSGTMCISPDGSHYAYGFEALFIYKRSSTSPLTYSQSAVLAQSFKKDGSVAFAGTCAFGGSDVAVGWYASSFKQNAVSLYDAAASKYKYTYEFEPDVDSIYQDLPVSSSFAEDASHFVIGTWGSSTGKSPTIVAFSTAIGHPIATYATTGSIFAVDILRDHRNGNVVVIGAGKAVHANKMGDGGTLLILEVDHPTDIIDGRAVRE